MGRNHPPPSFLPAPPGGMWGSREWRRLDSIIREKGDETRIQNRIEKRIELQRTEQKEMESNSSKKTENKAKPLSNEEINL